MATVLLVFTSKAYKLFIHRLFLYLSVSAFVLLSSSYMDLLNYKCAAFFKYLLLIYSSYVYFLLLFWIIFYLFLLAAFRVQPNQLKHEVIGVVAVLVLPLSVEWVIPWKFDSSNSFSAIYLYIFYIPLFVFVLLTSVILAAVLACLVRGALKRDAYSSLHKKAIKETLPLLIFVSIHQPVMLFNLVYHVVGLSSKIHIPTFWEVLTDLYPLVFVLMPVLLLIQPHIRQSLRCAKRHNKSVSDSASVQQSAVQGGSHTHQTSHTHYTVPAETSYTEQEPLIIRQDK